MRLMWTPRDPKGKARSPRVQPTVSRQDALAAPQLSSHPQACPLQQPKVKCSKFECGRRAGSSGPIVGPPGLRRPELVRLPETLGRVAAGLLRLPGAPRPQRALPDPQPALVFARTPLPRKGSSPSFPFPLQSLQRQPPARRRVPDPQLLSYLSGGGGVNDLRVSAPKKREPRLSLLQQSLHFLFFSQACCQQILTETSVPYPVLGTRRRGRD
ncbi:PREDICTED: uncharacterized protein LOC105522326 [Colobus angolensis palliatus]|uniref:uncharacterized protein LOC105522326 n=1 Tax=Colobus angolensis palliatus TaxID=336983 RepID=UPI0005F44FD3|nr:PREDICTED: uncharacterized protein LOC105522326 [Colobus angolensis palliatus]